MSNPLTALFGGSFKPPTKGHLEVILQGLRDNPNIEKILIAVGQGTRENINQSQSVKIWEAYQKLIPIKSEVIPVTSPYLFYRNYLKEHKEEEVYVFIGARPNNEKDRIDVLERSKFVKKYSKNVIPTKVITKEETSGTKARKCLREDIEKFHNYLPEKLSKTDKLNIILEVANNKILYAFDLDDTLITSKSDVIVTNPEKGTFRLTPAEYALYEPGPDDELDFSEFAHLKDPKIIKSNFELFSKILDKSSQLSGAKTIILTARQPEVATDLEAFLEKKNLPQVTLHAVGSSDPKDKLKVIEDYISKGFNKIRFYDDAKPNIELIKSLNSPEVDVVAKLVSHGPLSEILSKDDEKDYFGLNQFAREIMKEEKLNYNPYIDSINTYMEDNGMNIQPLPKVNFIEDDADNAADILGKTAFYDPNQREITLFTMSRHPKDVLRSYAHEMIHHIQNLEDRLGDIKGTDTREDDHLTNIEREAYTDGNLAFRKWTETLTEGQIKELDIQNPQEIKFWALHAHLFSTLRKDPSKFEELKDELSGESLGALYYFWDLLEKGELNEDINPIKNLKVYHSTDSKFEDFSLDYAWDGFWFTDDLDSLKNKTAGASGGEYILTRYITLKNPASWDEYDKYSIGELINMGYDGVFLPDEGRADYLVFDPKSISKDNNILREIMDPQKYKMGTLWFKRWWKPKKEKQGWKWEDDGEFIWITRPNAKHPTIKFEKSTGLLQGDFLDYKERQW